MTKQNDGFSIVPYNNAIGSQIQKDMVCVYGLTNGDFVSRCKHMIKK